MKVYKDFQWEVTERWNKKGIDDLVIDIKLPYGWTITEQEYIGAYPETTVSPNIFYQGEKEKQLACIYRGGSPVRYKYLVDECGLSRARLDFINDDDIPHLYPFIGKRYVAYIDWNYLNYDCSAIACLRIKDRGEFDRYETPFTFINAGFDKNYRLGIICKGNFYYLNDDKELIENKEADIQIVINKGDFHKNINGCIERVHRIADVLFPILFTKELEKYSNLW